MKIPATVLLAGLAALTLASPQRFARGDDPPPAAAPDPAAGARPEGPDPDAADGPVPFVDAVNKAIDRGTSWLIRKQSRDGTWGTIGGKPYGGLAVAAYDYPVGTTALALYALLKCHVPLTEPAIKKGFDALKARAKLTGSSYETSVTLLAVTAMADPWKRGAASQAAGERVRLDKETRKWAQSLVDDLLRRRASGALGWRYNQTPGALTAEETKHGTVDLSSTQLACLALFAAERCGIKIDSKVWDDLLGAATSHQQADGPENPRAVLPREPAKPKRPAPTGAYAKPASGEHPKDHARGFSYLAGPSAPEADAAASGSMTACGLGTMMMARHVLSNRDDKVWKARDAAALQRSIYDGYAWLDANWSATQNTGQKTSYTVYYLYCVERAMDLTGCILLGLHNWYVEMGEPLINLQQVDGSWNTHTTLPPEDVQDTCFALLFLKRATRGGIPFPSVTGGSDTPPADDRGK